LTALILRAADGPILLINVYVPTDYGTSECIEEYIDLCSKITVLFNDYEAAYLMVIGDFNCA